jgi:hypothetical protein
MRRRSALGVIGGAVAGMALPLPSDVGAVSLEDEVNSSVSSRDKYLRALVLCDRICEKCGYWSYAGEIRHVQSIGFGTAVVRKSIDTFAAFSSHEVRVLERYCVLRHEVLTGMNSDLMREMDVMRSQSTDQLLGLSVGDRAVAREVFALAIGMLISTGVCSGVSDTSIGERCYVHCDTPRSLVGVSQFSKKIGGWELAHLHDGVPTHVLDEVVRGINNLKPDFMLSELRKLPMQEIFPHVFPLESPPDPKVPVLAGVKFPICERELSMFKGNDKYEHIPENRINLGYRSTHTGDYIDGDAKLGVFHGYMWMPETPPQFFTDGVTVCVTDDGVGFAVEFITNIWFNKKSVDDVIAFAVLKNPGSNPFAGIGDFQIQ